MREPSMHRAQFPKIVRGRSCAWLAKFAILLIVGAVALLGCHQRHPAPHEGVTISYFRLGWSQPDERPAAQRLSEDFTRESGISITHPPVPETSLSQLDLSRKLVREGEPTVDVMGVDLVWAGVLGSDILDLRPYFAEEIASMDPQLLPVFTVRGKLVAIPYQIHVGVIEYRTDLLREYGFNHPPRSWDELETMAQKIQAGERAKGKKDFWGYVWQGAAAEPSFAPSTAARSQPMRPVRCCSMLPAGIVQASANTMTSKVTRYSVIALSAPTRVSPPTATKNKQHQENNQNGFHVVPHVLRGSWTGLCNGRFTSSLINIIEVTNAEVWSHKTTLSAEFAPCRM